MNFWPSPTSLPSYVFLTLSENRHVVCNLLYYYLETLVTQYVRVGSNHTETPRTPGHDFEGFFRPIATLTLRHVYNYAAHLVSLGSTNFRIQSVQTKDPGFLAT